MSRDGAGWWQEPPVLSMSASVLVHHAEIQLLERDDDDDDKKIELTVLMSTRPVAPHIAGCITSVAISLIPG